MHTSIEDLLKAQKQAETHVEVGAYYCHYKNPNKRYKVLYIGFQEATQQPCVVYENPDGIIWVRNLDDWLDMVENESGQKVPRFQKVD